MKIAFLTRSLEVGGAERQLVNLAAGLHDRGHDVTVIAFYGGGGFEQELSRNGVPVVSLGKSGRWDVVRFVRSLRRAIRSIEPSILYSFMPVPNLAAAFARIALPRRPKLVWGVRSAFLEFAHYDRPTRFMYVAERRLSFLPDLIVANSSAAREEWRGVHVEIVPNGIDTVHFATDRNAGQRVREALGIGADEVVIGRVARLDPMKDHATFVRAAALVAKTHANARFLVVGSGNKAYEEEMKCLATGLGLERSMMWIAQRSDMPSVYNALDVCVSSSDSGEGFPNVIAEAMSCGVPCVVTDVGDSREIVADASVVVPPREPEHLARAIGEVLRSDRSAAAQTLRERIVGCYSIPSMVERTETLLLGLESSR